MAFGMFAICSYCSCNMQLNTCLVPGTVVSAITIYVHFNDAYLEDFTRFHLSKPATHKSLAFLCNISGKPKLFQINLNVEIVFT